MLDERVVLQVVHDDLARDRVGQRDVGADVDAQPQVAPLGRFGAPGVDHDQGRSLVDRLQDTVEEDGVCGSRIGAPQQDEVGVLDLLI